MRSWWDSISTIAGSTRPGLSEARGRKGLLWVVLLAAAVVLAASTGTRAEVTATKDAIITFDSKLIPRVLPRNDTAPVAMKIEGHVKARKGREPGSLTKIELAIHRAGNVFPKNRPTCRISSIDPATPAVAQAACPGSKIGYGRMRAQSQFPGQDNYYFNGRITAFNGVLENGQSAVLLHVFNRQPPSSFVVPFGISRHSRGQYGTVLTAPARVNRWSRITDFTLVLNGGGRKGYLNASCPAPKGFTEGFAPFVQATLSFSDGTASEIPVVSSCRVAR